MRKIWRVIVYLLAISSLSLAQQVLVLNDGTRMAGRFDGGNANHVWFIDEHGNRHNFDIGEIQSVMFNSSAPGTGASDRYGNAGVPQGTVDRGYADTDAPPDGNWTRHAVLPAGTEIVVRTIDPIEARQPDPNRRFVASIERDVVDANRTVVIPRGSSAHLIVREVGNGEVAVDLRSVNVSGRRYLLNSEDITDVHRREGLGANERTGKFAGGGAVVGTILGAIAGGGKGAAIGALAGGAAGAGAEVATRGPALHIPSETVLRFRLDRPVSLYE